MARRLTLLLIAFLALVIIAEDCAHGFPPWRRRRRYTGGGGGPVQVAVKNPAALSEYPEAGAVFNYNRARDEAVAFTDRIRMFVEIHDEEILASDEPLVAEVRLTDLSNSEHDRIVYVPVTTEAIEDSDSRLGVFEVANIKKSANSGAVQKGAVQKDATSVQKSDMAAATDVVDSVQKLPTQKPAEQPLVAPESVYRAFVVLHRRAPNYDTTTAWGRLRGPYYVATSGDTPLAKARHHIVMRTFKEFYYTERGWRRDENSPLDCHAYYRWATGSCTKGSTYGYANVEWLFDRYHGGGDVAGLAAEEAIHADYVRIPGHTFMLLDYDTHLNQVWTMESNFNYTVEVALRPPGSSWTVGHLDESHIREDMFRDEADAPMPASETADAESSELMTASAAEPMVVR